MEYPDDFRCPISLEVMADPVILSSGHTFDRASIQQWLDSGNRTCPVTKIVLPEKPSLIPNHALRSLIDRVRGTYTSNRSKTAAESLDLVAGLTYPADPRRLDRIRALTASDPNFRRQILDSGKAATVVLRHAASAESWQLQETALRVVLDLTLHGDDAKVGLVADGATEALVAALRGGSSNCQALAATAITSLAVLQVNKCTIGGHPRAIPELVGVLKKGKGRERREAATALYVLCTFKENRARCVRAGAVPVLVELAGDGLERAIEVMEQLGKGREGREAMEKADGLVAALASVLVKGSERGVGDALSLLNLLCRSSRKVRSEAVHAGVSEICTRMGKNASALMETLETVDWS
ncbi:plant U-box 8 [Wolffia australiana]